MSPVDVDVHLERGQLLSNACGDYVYSSFFYFIRSLQLYSRPTLLADMSVYRELLEGNQGYGAGIANTEAIITGLMVGNSCLLGKSKQAYSFAVEGIVEDIDSWLMEQKQHKRIMCVAVFHIYKALVLFYLI